MSDVLIRCQHVGKKFCRTLQRSLWYGVADTARDLLAWRRSSDDSPAIPRLRPGEFWANDNVSFEIKGGECLGLLGNNGAGKTTLLKLLSGLLKPDTGRIEVRGRLGALIALGAGFNPILTGRENIHVNASILGLSRSQIQRKFDSIVAFAELEEFIDTPVHHYSTGMAVRLGFAIAISISPDVLLIDEVLAVGDATFRAKCINSIRELQRHGVAICLVSHNLQDILRYCDTGVYLSHGKLKDSGPIDTVATTYFLDAQASQSAPAPDGSVQISPNIVLGPLKCTSPDGRHLHTITPHEPVSFALPFSLLPSWNHSSVVLEFVLEDSLGIFYQGISPPLPLAVDESTGRFEIRFASLSAVTSTMVCGIAVWDSDMRALLAWSRGNSITVCSPNTAGRVALNAAWHCFPCSALQHS